MCSPVQCATPGPCCLACILSSSYRVPSGGDWRKVLRFDVAWIGDAGGGLTPAGESLRCGESNRDRGRLEERFDPAVGADR